MYCICSSNTKCIKLKCTLYTKYSWSKCYFVCFFSSLCLHEYIVQDETIYKTSHISNIVQSVQNNAGVSTEVLPWKLQYLVYSICGPRDKKKIKNGQGQRMMDELHFSGKLERHLWFKGFTLMDDLMISQMTPCPSHVCKSMQHLMCKI